ncbi:uncharacterized protein A1O5_05400 [Cladophialophora psammophila CBS 110553]|uniref:Uncharacterized protein n=1 Tax=Cladophialophora psammophila CBS 110553 TaxID=1182543 RepID=W9WTQ8_9EURO|nr:uncharacterized protein A1O5_05400 [Cladophialophora psammophila CBS 110553]EXJ71592.1 hypothetical protein A1O5_05400 [Cladophialophora psammophila CBS 110553]
MSDAAFAQSTWNSQVGWVASNDHDAGESPSGRSSEALASNGALGEGPDQPTNLTALKRGRILRLRNAFRSRIRNGTLRPQGTTAQSKQQRETSGDVEGNESPASSRDLSRRRAETLNLCRGKIKGLTGNDHHIRRKSVNTNKGTTELTRGDSPLLGDDIIAVPTTDLAAESSDNESAFGSLTRSFASAVDKLDFYSNLPCNMSFLRSRSSFFNPNKREKRGDDRDEVRRQFPPISPSKPAPPVAQSIAASSPTDLSRNFSPASNPRKLHPAPRPVGPPIPGARGFKLNQEGLASRQPPIAPLVFSAEKNAYVPAAPVAGYPRGVNPLRMHPPGAMAVAPSGPYQAAQALPVDRDALFNSPRRHTTTPNSEDREGSDTGSLDDAPIYSPSLGDLSQYARDTPRSTNAVPNGASRDQIENAAPIPSPVKNDLPAKGQSGPLKKSRSGLGLFSRSKPENASPIATGNGARGESPLYQGDANQQGNSGSSTGKMVKKSRSLHFGGLFKRKDPFDLVPSMGSSPFQPATPSPLRKVMRYGSQSTKGGGNSPTTQSAKR